MSLYQTRGKVTHDLTAESLKRTPLSSDKPCLRSCSSPSLGVSACVEHSEPEVGIAEDLICEFAGGWGRREMSLIFGTDFQKCYLKRG